MNNDFNKNEKIKHSKKNNIKFDSQLNNNIDSQETKENVEETNNIQATESVEVNDTSQSESNKSQNKTNKKAKEKPLVIFGGVCIAACILAFIFVPKAPEINTSSAAKKALSNNISNSLTAGTVLLKDDKDIESKDYTISHEKAKKDCNMLVWDFAAEDGDYVQVLVNGKAVTDSFMIKNKPKKITVPSEGKIQVKGIKDGGGGITYAVSYDFNNYTYYNSVQNDKHNTYTLELE